MSDRHPDALASWGRFLSGSCAVLGAASVFLAGADRIIGQAEEGVLELSEEQVWVAFLMLASGMALAVTRGFLSILDGPGENRAKYLAPITVAIVVLVLFVARNKGADLPLAFWFGMLFLSAAPLVEDFFAERERMLRMKCPRCGRMCAEV